ncbi:MAG: rod shape-determining protein MreD [Xanthomonadales bacterium]|nr:rod shape-determining protein MreD [Xanthomonadales bacterium]
MSRRRESMTMLVLILLAACLLTILPLPGWLAPLWPYWVGLVMIYWVLELPDMTGLGMAFVVGLFLDILTASLMGLNALSLVILVYLVQRFRARLRFFPAWQQALSVLALLINDQVIRLWVAWLVGEPFPDWRYWLSPLVGMTLWPWVFLLLDRIRAGRRRARQA